VVEGTFHPTPNPSPKYQGGEKIQKLRAKNTGFQQKYISTV
jgi:hypothetical protein